MAVTNKSISDINVFPTKTLYNDNKSSLTDSDISLVQSDAEGGILDLSLTQKGYIKYSNGLIIQWGWYNESANINDLKSFPIAFPNKCVTAIASNMFMEDSTHTRYVPWIEPITNSQFYIGVDEDLTDNGDTYNRIAMIAIGY